MAYSSWSVVFGEQPSASKWNILGTNDAHFYSFLGDNLAWQTWSPSYTNITVGNGTTNARYTTVGKTVFYRLVFTLGTTSAMGSIPTFTLPVTSISPPSALLIIGHGTFTASSVTTFIQPGIVTWTSTTIGTIRRFDANNDGNNISSTQPFVWTTGDQIVIQGFYEIP